MRKLLISWLSVSVILKNKAALDAQKSANLGLKCVRMRLAAGLRPDLLGELERSPRPPIRNWEEVCLLLRVRKGKGKRERPPFRIAKVQRWHPKVWGSANYA